MKQCPRCQRARADGNLWCQETCCPAETSPPRLRPGDRTGEIEILKWSATLPAATLYQAQRTGQSILLKVAHPGHEDKLKREALFLLTHRHPALPQLLPAYSDVVITEHPYGKVVVGNQILNFAVFNAFAGQTLRELLDQNPYPWYKTTGWLIAGLADALAFLHDEGLYHLCLTPNLVMVRLDKQGIPRPLLVDLGVACAYEDIHRHWYSLYVPYTYAAPEIFQGHAPTEATDVYGLGILLREMLNGRQPLPASSLPLPTSGQSEIPYLSPAVERSDLKGLPTLAEWSTQVKLEVRVRSVLEFAADLLTHIPPVPPEETRKILRPEVIRLLAFTALFVASLLMLMFIF